MKVAIIGGTGKLGLGFVARLQRSSHEVAVGSRDISKAQDALRAAASGSTTALQALTNDSAAAWCDAAIMTIPYSAHRLIISPLQQPLGGKIVIDATVPLNYENIFQIVTESGKSAAEETQELLGNAAVFAAFHSISHRTLRKTDQVEDVLVAGNANRKPEVMQLIRDMNLRPIDAGPLEAAGLLERMTALLISINKQNKVKESGLKVTGI
jgi:NADPH-dependent F420 reductase